MMHKSATVENVSTSLSRDAATRPEVPIFLASSATPSAA